MRTTGHGTVCRSPSPVGTQDVCTYPYCDSFLPRSGPTGPRRTHQLRPFASQIVQKIPDETQRVRMIKGLMQCDPPVSAIVVSPHPFNVCWKCDEGAKLWARASEPRETPQRTVRGKRISSHRSYRSRVEQTWRYTLTRRPGRERFSSPEDESNSEDCDSDEPALISRQGSRIADTFPGNARNV